METIEAYLRRKHHELRLLDSCLKSPLLPALPQSMSEVIEQKFKITAAVRAQQDLNNWNTTETAWSLGVHDRSDDGAFEFEYDYQRADLDVHGPSFYEFMENTVYEPVYTAAGMAAISALLLASSHAIKEADILVLPGAYAETSELIKNYAGHLRLVTAKNLPTQTIPHTRFPQILLLDSSAPAFAFEEALGLISPQLDLLVFDTSCFSCTSGRIRRVLNRAEESHVPVAMVRSHTKLDSLGAEYGRLGSAVFVHSKHNDLWRRQSSLTKLPNETRNAVRLFGSAALPAHFPPYVGSPSYRPLTSQRVAAILRNCRRSSRYFETEIRGSIAELHFAHGLYLTLSSRRLLDEASAREVAAMMSDDLNRAGFPIKHAGSFGFDFAATEWVRNPKTDGYSVRIAVADLPTVIWDDLTKAIVQWWKANNMLC